MLYKCLYYFVLKWLKEFLSFYWKMRSINTVPICFKIIIRIQVMLAYLIYEIFQIFFKKIWCWFFGIQFAIAAQPSVSGFIVYNKHTVYLQHSAYIIDHCVLVKSEPVLVLSFLKKIFLCLCHLRTDLLILSF